MSLYFLNILSDLGDLRRKLRRHPPLLEDMFNLPHRCFNFSLVFLPRLVSRLDVYPLSLQICVRRFEKRNGFRVQLAVCVRESHPCAGEGVCAGVERLDDGGGGGGEEVSVDDVADL